MSRSFRCGKALPFLVLVALACSSTVEPRHNVSVLVTNGTCASGQCAPLQVLGFPSRQLVTPGGPWSLDVGTITGPSACVDIPLSASFRVTGSSPGDTVVVTWTNSDSLAFGSQPLSAPRAEAAPSTGAFVPASAPGWSVTLPGTALPVPAEACTP